MFNAIAIPQRRLLPMAAVLALFGTALGRAEERPATEREAKLREVLARQKGDELVVYVNGRGAYVNGKSLSGEELSTVVRDSELDDVVVRAEEYVSQRRVDLVLAAVRKGGAEKTRVTTPVRDPRADAEAKLRTILHRQKGDRLEVYLNGRGTYVNGKQLARGELATIVRASGLESAVVTAQPFVAADRIEATTKTLRAAGIEEVERATPPASTPRTSTNEGTDPRVREVLGRQRGDRLKVYVNRRGVYVNGRSLSLGELQKVVDAAKLDDVVLTSEPIVSRERLKVVEEAIRAGGVDDFERVVADDD